MPLLPVIFLKMCTLDSLVAEVASWRHILAALPTVKSLAYYLHDPALELGSFRLQSVKGIIVCITYRAHHASVIS